MALFFTVLIAEILLTIGVCAFLKGAKQRECEE
jgi:hypothetical protein